MRVLVKLSREPGDTPQLFYRAADGEPKALEMNPVQAVYGFSRVLTDVNEPLEYFVVAGRHKSPSYNIKV
ncbi:MAG: hypothetical protein ACYS5V_16640, partial [Planctomycetota bacterium]